MAGIINWERILELANGKTTDDKDVNPTVFWDQFGYMYDKMSRMEKNFTRNQVNSMILDPQDRVLDVGCGTGRLCVPISKKVSHVTAIDASPNMLNYAKKYANEENVDNISFHLMDWNNDNEINKLEKYDVVFASRTVALKDVKKLNKLAKKYVFLLSFANGPSLRSIQLDLFRGVKGNLQLDFKDDRQLGYNIRFNMLYDLGIDASVIVVKDGFEKDYQNPKEAYDDLRTLGTVDEDQEELFRENVNKYLLENQDGSVKFLRETSSYVMWWKPEDVDLANTCRGV
ncbi:methyltransferase domain-containing protein [Paenibacillus sp. SYP-B3998]|uniref:Methyltransferase domain-containing protein n=1 Tax=Paenibacillus sp. SYP-B3998 TaxID=2678564 RepID=A0A6G3ZWW8_9BACL|nr:class I SAM-dependent methyltransferase [Paenibacillus sp. SYP-B3998]NEW05907.1 methyltransferase domain-containing protein [Paenibacillus sp. SYP-B3998]